MGLHNHKFFTLFLGYLGVAQACVAGLALAQADAAGIGLGVYSVSNAFGLLLLSLANVVGIGANTTFVERMRRHVPVFRLKNKCKNLSQIFGRNICLALLPIRSEKVDGFTYPMQLLNTSGERLHVEGKYLLPPENSEV